MKKGLMFLMVAMCVAMLFVACGGSDDTDSNNFNAWVCTFGTENPAVGVTVWLLDNDGNKMEGFEAQVTDVKGLVHFENVPEGKVGFLCEGIDDEGADIKRVDTYQFNINSDTSNTGDSRGEKLWSVDMGTYTAAPALAGITLDDGTAVVAGAVYWVDPADDDEAENIVGCATVTSSVGGDIRYMGDNSLPTLLSEQDSCNPLNGYYLVGNATPGTATFTAHNSDGELGSTTMQVFADAITIGNIYAGVDSTDPLGTKSSITENPAECQPDFD